MSITYPAHSSAAAELVLPLTAYRDAYGNCMLTDRASAVTLGDKVKHIGKAAHPVLRSVGLSVC